MRYCTALFAVIARLFRPSEGLHSDPCGYVRAVVAEVRRRSRRVRRYAADVPTVAELPASPPVVPARRTAMSAAVPVVDPLEVQPQAALIRGYYVAHERQRAERYADQQRLGVAVLVDIAETVGVAR